MKLNIHTLVPLFLSALAATIFAGSSINVDQTGIALQGYDPVAFFTDGKPVLGNEEFHSSYHEATYHFASAEHRSMFEKDPAKYEPQFGGYCAYGVSKGHLAPVQVDAFQIVDGKLLMQYDLDVKKEFNKNLKAALEAADKNWPAVSVQKK